jgi:hypothetical protein
MPRPRPRPSRSIPRADRAGSARGSRSPYRPVAETSGYKSAYAFPMRLRDQHVGSLNIFRSKEGAVSSEDLLVLVGRRGLQLEEPSVGCAIMRVATT